MTEIEFAEQPAALFEFVPPQGVALMSMEVYVDLCGPGQAAFLEGPPCSGTPPVDEKPPREAPPPERSPTPSVHPTPGECAGSSAGPNEPASPLTWTQASLKEDWPAPVRAEPDGGAPVVTWPGLTLDKDGEAVRKYTDPLGDTGSECFPWVDIRDLEGPWGFGLASNQAPVVDPAQQWMAYGVVFDVDSDGVPDWRYGMDNMPLDATGERPHRVWVTDLHTGRTESAAGPPYGAVVGDSFYPDGYGVRIGIFGPGRPGRLPKNVEELATDVRFYAWASVIQAGRVVAADYAPDVGWLDDNLLGAGEYQAMPFLNYEHSVCNVPPQPGCRETDRAEAVVIAFTLPDGWAWNDSDNRVDVRGKRVSPRDGLIKQATGMTAPDGVRLQFLRGGWLKAHGRA